jgi:tetratricopeptide (TPR) repeat protein
MVYHLFRLCEKNPRPVAAAISSAACGILLALTFFRNTIWLNEINFWSAILGKFPDSAVAQYSLGAAYMKENDLERAELHMNNAVKCDPRNCKAWRNKGALHMRQGRTTEALKALNKSLEIFPFAKAYFTRAMLYHSLHSYALAISDADKVLEQQPNDARAYYLKADCEEQCGKSREALENLSSAIAYDDREPLFLIRRGLLQAKSGNMKAALSDLDKAVLLKPDNGELFYYRAVIRYSIGQDPCADLHQALKNGYGRAHEMLDKICK